MVKYVPGWRWGYLVVASAFHFLSSPCQILSLEQFRWNHLGGLIAYLENQAKSCLNLNGMPWNNVITWLQLKLVWNPLLNTKRTSFILFECAKFFWFSPFFFNFCFKKEKGVHWVGFRSNKTGKGPVSYIAVSNQLFLLFFIYFDLFLIYFNLFDIIQTQFNQFFHNNWFGLQEFGSKKLIKSQFDQDISCLVNLDWLHCLCFPRIIKHWGGWAV